jgi:hypothetical protein
MEVTMKYTKWAPVLVLAGLVAACEQSPVGPSPTPQFTHGVVPGPRTATAELVWVCKVGPAASGPYNFNVDVSGSTSFAFPNATFSLNAGECIHIATGSNPGATVVVSEDEATLPAGVEFVSISVASVGSTPNTITGSEIDLDFGIGTPPSGAVITFTNRLIPTPGDEGCTPGYWKQSQHFDSWEGYATGDDFDTVFGVDLFNPDITLLQALNQGGGGVNALARHAVAALLNAASSGVDASLTEGEVIQLVQDASLGLVPIETAKNTLAASNELGCPLN